MNNQQVRVRFAPSPTGPLHIGGVRTALYNYLFARKNNGSFIIRIEDTDQSRYVAGAEEYIIEALKWLGIEADESPQKGGPFGPYRQSERKAIYLKYAQQLVDSGHAYYAFDTPEELDQARKLHASTGSPFQYNQATRTKMKNSLNMPEKEVKSLLEMGSPHVIRIKIPANEEIKFRDEIRGLVEVNSSDLDDKVILKSDGMPTYHLAFMVDDQLMKISHVIRGEEWLPSAPVHMLLYQYLGWKDTMPVFAHLPLLLKPEGNGKLSKRDADKGGFPIFPVEWNDPVTSVVSKGFREYGYLPAATVNFLALLGWNPGTEQELFSLNELIENFSIEKVNKSGAKFDIEKAKYFNQQYIRQTPAEEFLPAVLGKFRENKINPDPGKLKIILGELKERVTFPEEFYEKSIYFFKKPDDVPYELISKKYNSQVAAALEELAGHLENKIEFMSAAEFRDIVTSTMEKNKIKAGQVMQIIRIMVTGTSTGIDLMQTLELIGPLEVSERIKAGIRQIALRE